MQYTSNKITLTVVKAFGKGFPQGGGIVHLYLSEKHNTKRVPDLVYQNVGPSQLKDLQQVGDQKYTAKIPTELFDSWSEQINKLEK